MKRAYLAGLGTAGSLVAGAAVVFILASALVSFRGWPLASGSQPAPTVVTGRLVGQAAGPSARVLSALAALRPGAARGARGAPRSGGSAAHLTRRGSGAGGRGTFVGTSPAGGSGSAGSSGSPGSSGSGSGSGSAGGTVSSVTGTAGSAVTSLAGQAGSAISGASSSVGRTVGTVSPPAGKTITSVGQTAGGTVSKAGSAAGGLISKAPQRLSGLTGGL